MRRTPAAALVTGLLTGMLVLPTAPARACSVEVPPTLDEAIGEADVVFFGRVVWVDDQFEDGRVRHGHTVAVEQLFTGSVHERVLISSEKENGCFGGPISDGRQLFLLDGSEGDFRRISYLSPRQGPPRTADVVALVGPAHAPKPGPSPAVEDLAAEVRRKDWTVRLSATVIGLLLGGTLGWRLLARR